MLWKVKFMFETFNHQPDDLVNSGASDLLSVTGLVFQGQFTGKSHISWENRWFPVKIFP
jgi:hypothetical protein